MKEQDHALEILIAACGALARRFEEFTQSPERIKPWPEHIRRASSLVEDALRQVQKYELGPASSPVSSSGATITRLANRILGTNGGDAPLAPAALSRDDERSEGLCGYSWAVTIPDLLGFLKLLGKTGLLTITLGKEVALIELERGEVVSAISDNSPRGARLGEILVEQGSISRGRFESLLVHKAVAGPQRLGTLLESEGLITRDQLRLALEKQIQMLFNRLFEDQSAYFTFVEGQPNSADGRVRMDVTRLLLESARNQDEREHEHETALALEPIVRKPVGKRQ